MALWLTLAVTLAAADYLPPDFDTLARSSSGDLGSLIERYSLDRENLIRFYDEPLSDTRARVLGEFYSQWAAAMPKIDFDRLNHHGKVDYLLLKSKIEFEQKQLSLNRARRAEISGLVPFADPIIALAEARQRVAPMDAAKAGKQVDEIVRLATKVPEVQVKATVANRAAAATEDLQRTLKNWYSFYQGYDPVFTWWIADPYKKADAALAKYAESLRDKAGRKDKDTIVGDPVGREALLSDLRREMIPYTPEQLIEIANKEFAWCEKEMLRASQDLGFGSDWKRAVEHVKNLYVPPGEQINLVRELADEATEYVEKNKLVTVPALAKETWRMQMMSPERQRLNPFFLGGESIIVAYPTNTMTQEEKLMSMRGNNRHFARATVFHELIPGHRLQWFMNSRYRPYRREFRTPFWIEGWALYWEMILWDRGFPKSPEDRIGMLVWRMHRCARIIFSLNFHLEKMTPQQCVDFLVDRVGFERDNAAGEVRRSFEGSYPPLYQAAYMLGALQIRALRRELVDSNKMPEIEFHDTILKLNSIPIEMLRSSLTNQPLSSNFVSSWKFYQ
jgi:hypothetical protein